MLGFRDLLISHFNGNSSHSYQLLLMCKSLSHHVFMLSTSGADGKYQWCFKLGVCQGGHSALFNVAPCLSISTNSFWACSSNSRFRSMARLKLTISSSLFFSLNLIIYYCPFRFVNITLCIDICKKVNKKAANDCSLAAV